MRGRVREVNQVAVIDGRKTDTATGAAIDVRIPREHKSRISCCPGATGTCKNPTSALTTEKFTVIQEMEKRLPASPVKTNRMRSSPSRASAFTSGAPSWAAASCLMCWEAVSGGRWSRRVSARCSGTR